LLGTVVTHYIVGTLETMYTDPISFVHLSQFIFKTEPFVIERIFDYPVSPEAKERMSFEERFEGFCVDLIKVRTHNGGLGEAF